jgi:hypothetical protein
VEGFGQDIKEFRGFSIKLAGGHCVDLGWARSAPSIFVRAAGAVVDQRRGPSPLVHGGPRQGGFILLIWAVGSDLRLWSRVCARRRRQASPRRRLAGTSPEVRRRLLKGSRGHGFGRGKALRKAGATGRLLRWLGGRLRRPWWLAPQGGGSPAAGVWRCALRFGVSEKDGGEMILTVRRSSGGRGIDGKGGGGGDQRRRPASIGGDGDE